MVRLLIRIVIRLVANALGLIVAWLLLKDDGFHIDGAAFVVAVLIFTVVEVVADPLITSIALRSAPALRGGVALVTTFVGLVITDVLSKGLSINGVKTWVLATFIVWLAALLAGLILPLFVVKKAVDERR